MDERSPRDPIRERARARLGQKILGKFRIDSLLGVGGMASVYAATHRNGNRMALKILHEHVSMDPDVRRLFRREALAANKVDHPGVVRILDDDVTSDGCGFLVMPLLVGETLQARLERLEKRLPMKDALLVGHAVLDVLAAAHAQGVVHRDIKPENVFISAAGDIQVLDFGVARFLEAAGGGGGGGAEGGGTRAGQAIGTPAFMSPEQALGRTTEIDAQSDLWSMGATLFLCLSGKHAHAAETSSELLVHAATRPARALKEVLPEVNPLLAQVVDRALAFEKRERWPDARAMQAALDGVYSFVVGKAVKKPPRLEPPPPEVLKHLEQRALEGVDPFAPTSAKGGERRDAAATRVEAPAMTGDTAGGSRGPWGGSASSGKKRAAGRRVGVALGVAVAAASAISIGVGVTRKGAREKAGPEDAQAVTVTPARAAYDEAIRAWRDGSGEASKRAIARALELDPSLGGPDLLWVVEGFTPARDHFQRAWEHRASLAPEELALLEALEPTVRVPAAPEEARAKLAEACARFPASSDCALSLANVEGTLQQRDAAEKTIDALLARDPAFAPAWAAKARSRLRAMDTPAAVEAYRACLKASPFSTQCSASLANIDSLEGNCREMESLARQMIDAAPNNPGAYKLLGDALLGQGGTLRSVREVYAQGRAVSKDDAFRAWNEVMEAQRLDVFAGDFDDAIKRQAELTAILASRTDESSHANSAAFEMTLYLELGDRASATRAANEFLEKRGAWTPDPNYDDSIGAYATLYLAGSWSREKFQSKQEAWFAATRDARRHGTPEVAWVLGAAQAIKTPEDAADALRTIPAPLPLLPANARTPGVDEAIGYACLLAGRLEEAKTYLHRATAACRDDEPLETTIAQLHLGEALEKLGEKGPACEAYAVVLDRWGREPRSVSAALARQHGVHLGCPPRPRSGE